MAEKQRVIIPFNVPLSPGPPANDQGVRKIENLLPVYGGLRSIPAPAGDTETFITVDDDDVLAGSTGISTIDVSGAAVSVGREKDESYVFFLEGALDSEPTLGTRTRTNDRTPIIGTRNRFFVDGETFTEYTRIDPDDPSLPFGLSPDTEAWQIQQFGEFMVATNGFDPLLRIGLNDPSTATGYSLSELVNTLTRPRAKHMTIVGGHVLLGNLSFSEDTNTVQEDDGTFLENPLINAFTTLDAGGANTFKGKWPNAIWWSAQNDATVFTSPANANATGDATEAATSIESLSDFEIIYDVPGEVTGLIGFPEAAVVFSEYGSSLLQLTRGPEVFERRVLELGVGCTSANSLVAVDQDVYFFSQDGFRVLQGFSKSQSIMPPQLRREVLDRRFGKQYVIESPDQIKFTLWDSSSRCIFWFYENLDNELVGVIYNIDDQRWSFLYSEDFEDYFVGAAVPSQYPLAGVYLAKKDSTNPHTVHVTRWMNGTVADEVRTLEATIRTKTFSLTPDQGQVGAATAKIMRMRPIYRKHADSDPQAVPPVDFLVAAALDPNMENVEEFDVITKTSSVRDQDGWYRPKHGVIVGCAFEIEAKFPEAYDQSVWDVTGVQVEFVPGGES